MYIIEITEAAGLRTRMQVGCDKIAAELECYLSTQLQCNTTLYRGRLEVGERDANESLRARQYMDKFTDYMGWT